MPVLVRMIYSPWIHADECLSLCQRAHSLIVGVRGFQRTPAGINSSSILIPPGGIILWRPKADDENSRSPSSQTAFRYRSRAVPSISISSFDWKAPRTSVFNFSSAFGFASKKYVIPLRAVAVVSEPATLGGHFDQNWFM